jgi:hypothetical protein
MLLLAKVIMIVCVVCMFVTLTLAWWLPNGVSVEKELKEMDKEEGPE